MIRLPPSIPKYLCRSPWHSASRDSKPSGYRRGHLPASPPSSSREWPRVRPSLGTWGRTLLSIGRNRWVLRTSISWWPGSRPTLPAWRPPSATLATPHTICPALCPSGNSTYTPRLTCATCSVSRMASAIRPSRVAAFPAPIRTKCRSRRASSSWGTRTRPTTSPPSREPEVLGRNGTYAVFRKLHTRVAAFRQHLHQRAKDRADEEWLAAKIVGRWPSGAPLALAPDKDDPELGADPKRNNAFMFGDDPRGLRTPIGSHVRRMNPRDSLIVGEARLHRMIRRGTNYGQQLPPGVLEDDGAERGLIFAFVGAHLDRQFEFVQREWLNDGRFIGTPAEKDPLVNSNDGREFTIPKQPIHRRLKGLPAFVVNRGGEYCFMPGLRALRWLANLDT